MSDIAEDIQAAIGQLESGDEPEGELETGDVLEGEAETGEVAEVEATGEEEEVETAAVEPPSHWSPEDQEAFRKAPPEIQEWALRRHNEMEAAFTRKTQEISEYRRAYEPVDQLFAPHLEELKAQGTTPSEVIQRWYQAEQFLTNNPVEGLQWLAQTFGVDLATMKPGEKPDPQVQSLQQELHQLKQAWTQREQQEQQAQRNTLLSKIQEFASATDGTGQPAHPHFDEVAQEMVILAQAERAAGRTPVLGDLYEKAVWANTSTREKLLASQRQADAKKKAEEARAKAAAARRAGSSVTGAPMTGGGSSAELSLREELEAQFRA